MARLFMLLLLCLLPATEGHAEKRSAEEMKALLADWPPVGWQMTPPGQDNPFPPYITEGEFSGTLYRQGDGTQIWSAHISITDQQTDAQAQRMLNNFPFCSTTTHNGFPARNCLTSGEELGRRRLAYAAGRFLVDISVIGPLPLELPEVILK